MTPCSSSRRSLRRQAEGESEMRSARARLLILPSCWSTVKIRQSVASSEIAFIFGLPFLFASNYVPRGTKKRDFFASTFHDGPSIIPSIDRKKRRRHEHNLGYHPRHRHRDARL